MPLAENVRRLRITDGQSIEDIAEATRLSPALVASIENGRRTVSQKAVRALAAISAWVSTSCFVDDKALSAHQRYNIRHVEVIDH